MADPEVKVVRCEVLFPIHPRLIERYERQRAEIEKILDPETLEAIDREIDRKFLYGE